jgi:hypothetical protein
MEVLDLANHKIIITGCNDDDDGNYDDDDGNYNDDDGKYNDDYGNYDDDDIIFFIISPCFLKGRVEAPVNFLRSQHLKKNKLSVLNFKSFISK